jgi:5-methylcytosine-specific restriction enzyme subunit McrC
MLYEVHAHRLQSAASLGNVPDGTEHLKQELRGRLDVVPEPNIYLGQDRQISMNPNLMFRQNGNNVFVGDLKYKLSEDGKGRSSDYYQLLAYLTSTGLQRGVLIYCQNDG